MHKAFAEVYDIILHLDLEAQKKIPEEFKQALKNKKDDTYIVKIDYDKSIADQKLLPYTRKIITLIYRDYLCSPEEREALKKNNERLLKENANKYNMFNIFENKESISYAVKEKQTALEVVKEKNVFEKLLERIIKFFKRY